MCRNIRTLFNFDPPATNDEVQAAAQQYVRKISGFTKPSKANEDAMAGAVAEITATSRRLLRKLRTHAPARNRTKEAIKAKKRAAQRFGTSKVA